MIKQKKGKPYRWLVVLLLPLFVQGCQEKVSGDGKRGDAPPSAWSAELVTRLSGFDVPECAVYDAGSDSVWVSNIESGPDAYWSDDGNSYLSKLGSDHKLEKLRWLDSSEMAPMHAAKGMCILDGHLYFTDNTRLMRCDLATGQGLVQVVDGFEKANDLATDGQHVWLSDTGAGKVYCIGTDGAKREVPAPASVNGLTFDKGRLYAVSWDLHDLYELDAEGENEPVAFGLADHFTHLDSIEVLADGSFLVSDFKGNKISTVSADRQVVKTLIDITSPADVGFDRVKGLLYIPSFMEGEVSVYKLRYEER
ncbi:MAG: SMP-30/gluconolactonase/LRE family protein [Verrucomicrobiae bacterium]|nr:SMP-30/gluconolactonase/LRE family protein [Verrucomicrobiae bacterium]NNJ43202.1 hypothetical protein [Akkermansiaceae bacterium]